MIKSVEKAIRILGVFSPTEPRLSLAEISTRLGHPKSTTHNLLATLLAYGFVEKAGDDQYALGTAIIPLTQSVRVNCEIRNRAAPLLRELANTSHESVYLTVPDGDFCLYIYAIETSSRLLARTAVGERAYLHRTAVGKAILAFLPHEEAHAMIERVGLPPSTENTITDHTVLGEELETLRRRGYSTDCGENEAETYCVGAPIFDANSYVVASCSVSGMDPAIVEQRLPEISKQVVRSALEISRRMGYVPTRSGFAPALSPAQEGGSPDD